MHVPTFTVLLSLIPSTYPVNEFNLKSLFLNLKTKDVGKSPVSTGSPDVPRTVGAVLDINTLHGKQKQSKICMMHGDNLQLPASAGMHNC